MNFPITYGVFEDVCDRQTNKTIESFLICECPDYVRAQRVLDGLYETINSKGPGGSFYIEYRIALIEFSGCPGD